MIVTSALANTCNNVVCLSPVLSYLMWHIFGLCSSYSSLCNYKRNWSRAWPLHDDTRHKVAAPLLFSPMPSGWNILEKNGVLLVNFSTDNAYNVIYIRCYQASNFLSPSVTDPHIMLLQKYILPRITTIYYILKIC